MQPWKENYWETILKSLFLKLVNSYDKNWDQGGYISWVFSMNYWNCTKKE
jgi:hypothetical protein